MGEGVGCRGGKGGVVTPRPFAPPHDHAQPQASIPKRYTTVASLSSPVIGLGPCWDKKWSRPLLHPNTAVHSRQGLRPAARTYRCLHPHLLATPQRASKQTSWFPIRNQDPPSRPAVRHCAGSARPSQDLQRKPAQSQTLAPQRTPFACYRNAGNPHNSTRTSQRLQRAGVGAAVTKNNHPNTGMPRRLLQSTRLHQGAGNQHKPSPLHRLLGATATRPASPTAPAARACRPCPSTLQKGGLGI